ncbi:MAG: hypothetical protein ACHREM_24300, partial [Polyangiales bacterium]
MLLVALSSCRASSDLPTEAFKIRESVQQLQVTHAPASTAISLIDPTGKVIQSGKTDALGSFVFRKVPPGDGYVVAAGGQPSLGHHVMTIAESTVQPSFYQSQVLAPGSGYITTRDGTTLSIYVTLPGPIEKGPYPTVVDY